MNPSINKTLYLKRTTKNYTLREMSKKLHISSLRLSLIEKGYLNVPKKKHKNFINVYKLPLNFFTTHSNCAEPISQVEDTTKGMELFKKISSKTWVKIVSLVCLLGSATTLSYGIYYTNRRIINPRLDWSNKFANHIESVRNDVAAKMSFDPITLDVTYTLSFENAVSAYEIISGKEVIYGKDHNAFSSSITIVHSYTDLQGYKSQMTQSFSADESGPLSIFTYDSDNPNSAVIGNCLYRIKQDGFHLPAFLYRYNNEIDEAKPGTEVYDFAYNVIDKYLTSYKRLIEENFLIKSQYTFFEFFRDVHTAFAGVYFDFTAGLFMSIFGAVFLVIFVFMLCFSFYLSFKKQKKVNVKVNENKIKLSSVSLPTRDLPNDISFLPFLPEFVLRIIGIIIVFLFSLTFFLMIEFGIHGKIIDTINVKSVRDICSLFLIAGTTLLFFVKIDVYHRKSISQILQNATILFIAGLIYYFFEVIFCACIATRDGLVNLVVPIFANYIPGNVLWNLMLYTLIFLFLFTTPKKIKNDAKKISLYRLCSLLPVLFIVGLYIFKSCFNITNIPYYISFLFYTKNLPIILFAILYLYGLYFLRLYFVKKYGKENAERFFNTRRYAVIKNGMASLILLILVCVDLPFMFLMKNNNFDLGSSWSLAVLIPLIMCYRPHIGKRNTKFDVFFAGLYGCSFASGYVASLLLIFVTIGFKTFVYLMM